MDSLPEEFNLASWLLDGSARRTQPNDVVLVQGDHLYPHRVLTTVDRIGTALLGLEVDLEDRVLLVLPDGIELATSWLAAVKIGAVPVCLPTDVPAEQLGAYLRYSRARAIVYDAGVAGLRERMAEAVPSSPHLRRAMVVGEAEGKESTWLDAANQRCEALDPAVTHRDDVACWFLRDIHVWEADGRPCAVCHTHAGLASAVESLLSDAMPLTERDVVGGPMDRLWGLSILPRLLAPLRAGAAVHLPRDSAPPTGPYAPTVLAGDPGAIEWMCAAGGRGVRLVVSEGAAPEGTASRVREALGASLVEVVGCYEAPFCLVHGPLGMRPGSFGRPARGCEARVLAADGATCPPGVVGDLWVRSGAAADGYWRRSELERQAFRGEWVLAGRSFAIDNEGYCWHRGEGRR